MGYCRDCLDRLRIRPEWGTPMGKGLTGAGDRGRTGDIFLGKEALYH